MTNWNVIHFFTFFTFNCVDIWLSWLFWFKMSFLNVLPQRVTKNRSLCANCTLILSRFRSSWIQWATRSKGTIRNWLIYRRRRHLKETPRMRSQEILEQAMINVISKGKWSVNSQDQQLVKKVNIQYILEILHVSCFKHFSISIIMVYSIKIEILKLLEYFPVSHQNQNQCLNWLEILHFISNTWIKY